MSDPIKLILLDLDETLWKGILLEDGLEGLHLMQPMADRLRALDKQGILIAAVSKNHADDVDAALKHFGLSDLFFTKEVSFEPKSSAVARILALVRFAHEACLFVDDTAFEREEVAHAFAGLRTVTPEQFLESFQQPGDWAISSSEEESQRRKSSYISEQVRRQAEAQHSGTFRQFLRDSALAVKVGPGSLEAAGRISELTLRTNQINFSSNRYQVDQVKDLLASAQHESYLAAAADRYGDYGVIGFACLRYEGEIAVVQDLMLSCRIQGKGVEAALITVLAEKAKLRGAKQLTGLYRPTRRNGQISGVYQSLGFAQAGDEGEYQRFTLQLDTAALQVPPHVRLVVSDAPVTDKDIGIPFVRDVVERYTAASTVHGGIIDIGAGWDGVLGEDCDTFLEVNGNKHIRLDMDRYPKTDIVANAQDMKDVADESFDSALCLEVLEHCTDPFALSRELIRVLRKGGHAVVSAPMNFPIHDTPGDFWRFTPDGLKLLFAGHAKVVSEYIEGQNDYPVRTVLVLQK
ncbi:HAD-IIIC family phosphatase [Roseibium suaedae]|uniref:HAD-superfamily phosphatase, subfamily IIIC/FkbH-like domain-containing protein n=1 Tax=Roseibium suaedae TaxID=735517 RepID=A0A1M7P6Z0_9HYPH|nr:HAD-IIIC family phosphatase [Roseibium suaedae]SHN12355.1 HAD-superfamily phosphatase, subfamily IIIC/FkbH-like domain-containing protein [Roseibium suaedae]